MGAPTPTPFRDLHLLHSPETPSVPNRTLAKTRTPTTPLEAQWGTERRSVRFLVSPSLPIFLLPFLSPAPFPPCLSSADTVDPFFSSGGSVPPPRCPVEGVVIRVVQDTSRVMDSFSHTRPT